MRSERQPAQPAGDHDQSVTSAMSAPVSRVWRRASARASTIAWRSTTAWPPSCGTRSIDVHHEMEAVELVEHDHVERRRRRAFLPVAANVKVAVIRAAVGEAVDQPRIPVIGEDHRLVGREDGVEIGVRETVRVLARRLQAHEIDHVHDAHPKLGKARAQHAHGGQRLERGDVAGAGHHEVGILFALACCPVPHAEPARAMQIGAARSSATSVRAACRRR